MKVAIILNCISRKKKKFYNEIFPALSRHFNIDVFETAGAGEAESLAAAAVANKFSFILSAGGDGTLHQVVNGVLKNVSEADLPSIGLIPLGSGNDFARAGSISPEPDQIIQLLKSAQPKPTDVGQITCLDKGGGAIIRYFMNACSIGMGPEVVKRMGKRSPLWGPDLSYFISIISTFISHRPQPLYVKMPQYEWKGNARVFAIANGQSFGNSIYLAPEARLDDGVFNSFIVGEVPLWKFLLYLQKIKGKQKINDSMVHYYSTSSAELSADESSALEADGEFVGFLPASIKVLPKKIRFLR